jgi:hypothetical protein
LGATVCLASAKARNKTKAQGEGAAVSVEGDHSVVAVDLAKPNPAQSILYLSAFTHALLGTFQSKEFEFEGVRMTGFF